MTLSSAAAVGKSPGSDIILVFHVNNQDTATTPSLKDWQEQHGRPQCITSHTHIAHYMSLPYLLSHLSPCADQYTILVMLLIIKLNSIQLICVQRET